MKPSLILVLPVLLAAGLTACGSDGEDGAAATTPENVATTATSSDDTTPAATAEPATPDASVETVTVDGAYGPIEVPADPQRIVADLMTVDYLTALGYDTS